VSKCKSVVIETIINLNISFGILFGYSVQRLLVDAKDKMLSFLFHHSSASVFATCGCPLTQVGTPLTCP